jgi:flagellar motility protein MotE (MotC chaperone)
MAKTDAEKQEYSALERFLYIILLPVLFALVLLGVLLTLFDYDVKGALTNIGRNIPVVKSFVPEDDPEPTFVNPVNAALAQDERLAELEAELAGKTAEIARLQSDLAAREQAYASLEDNVEQLVLGREQEEEDRQAYRARLKSLANMYAGMSARKAASILEQMTLPEMVLILYEMSADERGDILARMDPETAAAASLQLKDLSEASWAEFERRASDAGANTGVEPASRLTAAQLADTFAAMEPASAAKILLELKKQNSTRAIDVLVAMTEQARSRVLAAIAETSPADAAAIADQLGGR